MSATITLTLTPETEQRLRRLIDSGRYRDAESAIDQALALLETEDQRRLAELRELALAGHNSGIAGELDDERWDAILQRASERLGRGEWPDPPSSALPFEHATHLTIPDVSRQSS